MQIQIECLDHGFVKLRNISGPTRRVDQDFDASDVDPANAARMSFENMDSGRTENDDLKLSEYLMKNWHSTPFEMVEIWLEMKLPIFVARQFVRHRTVSINEVSGRYVTLPEEFYLPKIVGGKAKDKKQGQEDNLPEPLQHEFRRRLFNQCDRSYAEYLEAIEMGVAPEHARLFLHLNHYTHWLWKQDLHNMLHFLSRRDHFHAQIEAQIYAEAIIMLLERHLPHSMGLYRQYRKMG